MPAASHLDTAVCSDGRARPGGLEATATLACSSLMIGHAPLPMLGCVGAAYDLDYDALWNSGVAIGLDLVYMARSNASSFFVSSVSLASLSVITLPLSFSSSS